MSAGKTLNTGNALYSSIVRALSGDLDLPILRALDGGADTASQTAHHAVSTSEPTATWLSTQGIARDSSNWFSMNNGDLKKYDLSSNLLITNSTPFSGLPVGVDHIGDGFVDGLYLYVAISNYSGGTSTIVVIAKYLVTTLALDSFFDVSAQANLNGSGCCLNGDGTEILVTSFFATAGADQRNTDVYRFNKSTGASLGVNTLTTPSVGIQSITYHSLDEKYYLGSYNVTGNLNKIYVYDSSFTYITNIDPSNSGTEMEGVESFDDVLYFNNINGSPRVLDLSNVYISNAPSSDPIQFLDNSLMTDQVTIMMKITFHTLFNFNAIIDNLSTSNDWEAWVYASGDLAWRVSSSGRTSTLGMVAGQEYIIAFTWDHTSNVNIKTGVNGVYGSTVTTSWFNPPAAGMYLAGAHSSNNQGDNLYKDILVFDKVLSDAELLDSYTNFDNFYVVAGEISIEPNSVNSTSSSNNPLISFNSVLNVFPDAVNSLSVGLNPDVSFASAVNVFPSTINSVSSSLNPIVVFNSVKEIVPQAINSQSTSLDPVVSFSSAVIVNPNSINSVSVALNPSILFSGTLEVAPQVINSASVALNPNIDFSSVLNIYPNVVDSVSISNDPLVEFKSAINVNPLTNNSQSVAERPTVLFNTTIEVAPNAINSTSVALNPDVQLVNSLLVAPQSINSVSVAINPLIEFKAIIEVRPNTINSLSTSNNPTITNGEAQTIGNVKVGYKDNAVSVEYKLKQITVNYK